MDAFTEAFLRVLRRLDDIDQRLARVEDAVHIERPRPAPAAEPVVRPAEAAPPPPAPVPSAPRPRRLETGMGLTLLNRVGVITLVLGIGFFFKYAVENQWIGPTMRVVLGVAAGLTALLIAEKVWRTGQTIFAQGVAGAGAAILYVSFYTAFGLYGLVSLPLAFLLMLLSTAIAVTLALRYSSAAIAAIGFFGGYAVPIVLSVGQDRAWFHLGFVLLLDAGALWLAHRRGWRSLQILAFAGSVILYGYWIRFQPENRIPGTVFALAFFALFAGLRLAPISYAAHVLPFWVIGGIWSRSVLERTLLTTALLVAALALADWRNRSRAVLVALASFWFAYAAWEFPWPPEVGATLAFLSVAFLLVLAWTPVRALLRKLPLGVTDLLVLALNAAVYFAAGFNLLRPSYSPGVLAVAIAVLHMGLAAALWRRDERAASLAAGIAWVFLTLAIPVHFSGYRVTMIWALEAAALAWIGLRAAQPRAAYAAIAVFALTVLRLYSSDARMYPSALMYSAILNARFLTFLIAALSMWAAARWMRAGVPALATYVTGHFVMLWNLGLEVSGWAARTAPVSDIRSVQSAVLSIVMAAYAVLLVAAGVMSRTAVNRILGLGLIGIVVAKLYVYDVWLLERIYRVAAFAALGVLLLVISYLYSRYRDSVEHWWREN